MHRILIAALLAALALLAARPSWAVGETYYVSDELVIGVHADADLDGEPLDLLKSGTPVELVQTSGNAARVRVPSGQLGWIERDYLTDRKPSGLRVVTLQDENARLRAELDTLQAQSAAAQQELARLREHVPPEAIGAGYEDPRLLRLMEDNMALKKRLLAAADALGVVEVPEQINTGPGAVPLLWLLIAIGVTLLLGFIFGLLWLDRSIRRRHGGFRV